jgi:SAM-dependent methyltransferase
MRVLRDPHFFVPPDRLEMPEMKDGAAATALPPPRKKAPKAPAPTGWARRLPWPLPALLAWCVGWAVFGAGQALEWPTLLSLLLATVLPCAMWLLVASVWRRVFIAIGFPLSALVLGAAELPGWIWLIALLPLWLLYPLRSWRDAPFFPTGKGALRGLAATLQLTPNVRVLDAGCGLGDGLIALREAWPHARVEGVEWSRPLAWIARLRCGFARVRRGDMWRDDWRAFDVVYLFQRPESMARAGDKARAEMRPGTWLVSLEFPVPGWPEHTRLRRDGGRPVWVYRLSAFAAAEKTPRSR